MLKKSEETVISLLEMQQFTVPQIAKMLRITEEFVLQIADKLGLKVIR